MNKKMILKIISKIVMMEGILLLLPSIVGLYYNEYRDAKIYLFMSVITATLFYILSKISVKNTNIYAKDGLICTALIWIIWSLVGALPFYIAGYIPNYFDAFFETVSGFTTTGSTILSNIEGLSKSMLFWRSFTHWIGGMGVLVFVLAFIPVAERGEALFLLKAEVPGPVVGKLVPKAKKTAMILYLMYLFLTILEIIFLLFGKINFYEAVLHAFSTAGTGGFSTRNASVAAFNSPYIEYVISIFMVLFGINFNIYFFLLIKNFKDVFKNEELRLYLAIIAISVITITINIYYIYNDLEKAFRASLFQVTSIITTTGFITENFNLWPSYSKIVLMLLIVIGACAGSTGGGIKISRVLILLKEMKLYIKKLFHPRLVDVITIDNKKVEQNVRHATLMFVALYCLICVISIILVSINNFDFETTVTAVLTTLGNTGPGLGQVGAIENFYKFSNFSKIILSFDMLIGRLEILPILFIFTPNIWKK